MKFRAKMVDPQSMKELSNTIQTLSKLGKQAVISLTSNVLSIVVFEDTVPRRPLAQCTLQQKHFFSEYNVVGLSEEHNQICLQFSPDLLAKATSTLKSPQTSNSVKIKLTKKIVPCLTCEIEMPTQQMRHSRLCIHDVPVEIIPRKSWTEFELPSLPEFDLTIQMPSLKRLKIICERMKLLSAHLTLEANPSGLLDLKVETDLATAGTFYNDMKVEKCRDNSDSEKLFGVKIDFKKLIGFLSIEQLNPKRVVCNIVDKKMIFMEMTHDNLSFHYLIPGMLK